MKRGRWWWRYVVVAPIATLGALVAPSGAFGASLSASLAEAEASAASAESEISTARTELSRAVARYRVASTQAAPARRGAQAARGEVQALEATTSAERRDARERIAAIEGDHRREVEDHDDEVQAGIGLGLAVAVAAMLLLGWGWFRASAAVAWLVAQRINQAVALCLGSGLFVLLVGAALSDVDGVVGVFGVLLFVLGPILAAAFLLARHSAQVQAGRGRPLCGRERLPTTLTTSLAAVFGALSLILFAGALFSDAPRPTSIGAALKAAASGVVASQAKGELAKAEAKADALTHRAAGLTAAQSAAQGALRRARGGMSSARSRLIAARGDARRYAQRIEIAERREARQLEWEEERALVAAKEEGEFAEEEGGGCDPNYSGCVPDTGYDVDCAEVGGPVEVIGTDVDGLDADGDGIGCES